MSYRDDLEALVHRCEALEKEAGVAAKDLAAARHLLDEARQRAKLPVLDNLHIAAPCKADWNKMVGDDRARFCGQCEKNVYNLSSMTRAAAEALLIEKEGKLCVRYYQRADGTILTADCPDGVVRRRRRMRIIAASFGAMSAIAAAATALFARAPLMGAPQPIVEMPMGLLVPVTQGEPTVANIGVDPEGTVPKNIGVPTDRHIMGGPKLVARTPATKPKPPHPLMGKVRMIDPPIAVAPMMGDVAVPMMGEAPKVK